MNNQIILNKTINRSLRDMGNTIPKKEADSIEIDYNFNSFGYRCNEFDNQEILTLGCSQTEGHGLPLELTWPYILSKKMNKNYINLAKGGDGAQGQITKAFQFFKEFYHPKYIFAVFPLARLEVPLINLKTIGEAKENLIGKGIFNNDKILKYSKGPHTIENVLPEEFAVFYNILFIKMLIEYCKSNNIKLIWTAYRDMSIEFPFLNDLDNGYFESSNFLSNYSLIEEKCHLEFSSNEFFDYAADYDYWPPGHWGLHRQLHIAESMYNMI
jgi:hypothetical protein